MKTVLITLLASLSLTSASTGREAKPHPRDLERQKEWAKKVEANRLAQETDKEVFDRILAQVVEAENLALMIERKAHEHKVYRTEFDEKFRDEVVALSRALWSEARLDIFKRLRKYKEADELEARVIWVAKELSRLSRARYEKSIHD